MVIFYLIVGIFLVSISLAFFIVPQKVRQMVRWMMDRGLYLLPGVVEVGIGLGTLYFRSFVNFKSFVYIAGFLMFFDGILYLAAHRKIASGYEWILERDETSYRLYGIILLGIGIGYLFTAFL